MTWNFAIDPRKKKRTKKNEHNTKRRRQQQQQQQIKKTWIARESNDIFFSCFEFYNNGSDSKPYRRCRLELTVTLSLVKVYSCRWDCHCSCWNGGWEAPKYFKNKSYPTLMIVWIAIVVVLLVLMPTGTAVVDGDTTGKASTVLLSRRSRPSIRNLLLMRAVLSSCTLPVFTKRWRWVAKLRSHQKCPKPDRKKAKEYGPTIRQKTILLASNWSPFDRHRKAGSTHSTSQVGNWWSRLTWLEWCKNGQYLTVVESTRGQGQGFGPANRGSFGISSTDELASDGRNFAEEDGFYRWNFATILAVQEVFDVLSDRVMGSRVMAESHLKSVNPPSGRNRSCRRCLPMQANVATSRLLIRVLWREGKRIEAPVGKSYSYANRRSDVDSFSQFWNRTEW